MSLSVQHVLNKLVSPYKHCSINTADYFVSIDCGSQLGKLTIGPSESVVLGREVTSMVSIIRSVLK